MFRNAFKQLAQRRGIAGTHPTFMRPLSPLMHTANTNAFDASMKDATPLLTFDDAHHFPHDTDQMIFGPLDLEDHLYDPVRPQPFPSWDPYVDADAADTKPPPSFAAFQQQPYQFAFPQQPASPASPAGSFFDPSSPIDSSSYLSNWINDPDMISPSSPSSPISIPNGITATQSPSLSFASSYHAPPFSPGSSLSPTSYAASLPLPASVDSSPSFEQAIPYHRRQQAMQHQQHTVSPVDIGLQPPQWASQLWDNSGTLRTHSSPTRPSVRHSPLSVSDMTQRQRLNNATINNNPISGHGHGHMQRDSISIPTHQIFQSASAPSPTQLRAPSLTRSYSRRAESASAEERERDRDATVRRKKRVSIPDDPRLAMTSLASPTDLASSSSTLNDKGDNTPLKSVLRPPKLAPSAWQLYFTDWIQRQQASNTRKLNVAQAAKEAGQEYASLTAAEKEPYKRKSQSMKEARERDLAAYMRTLSPDDIKRENAYRTAQRKAGKSRKSNIKDPNAPKKPLSAYFMFLQRIRANPGLVREVFGEETETTKQSVLAAAKWRGMTDEERKPFLAQAEQEKMEYEAARRMYEEGTVSPYGSNINFSILPSTHSGAGVGVNATSPVFGTVKLESESESEGFTTDDGNDVHRC